MIDEKNNLNFLSKQYINNIIPYATLNNPIEIISTGNFNLDKQIGCGGIPRARITEIYGNESSGKTTLSLEIAKQCTLKKEKVLYIDLEYALDINYVKQMGIDTDYFFVAHAKSGEIAFAIIDDALIQQNFSLIIVDSVAAMLPESELECNIENNNILGAHSRLMSRGIRKIQVNLAQSKTALVLINQTREKIGVMFGNPETTTGGKALKFYASLRMEIKKVELIKSGDDKIGIKSKITITKNKLSPPFKTAFINIYFGEGFNYINDVLEFAISNSIIKRSGSWYYFNDDKIAQGLNNLKDYANNNKQWLDEIQNKCLNNSII